MGKIWVEVGLISARGLRRSSFLKLQWFAVGWIDPNNKYCTKVDASGNANPVWKTRFAALVDVSDKEFQDLPLQVEVYSREPIFLRERLHGRATIFLKEFLRKGSGSNDSSRGGSDETGSYQLRMPNSSRPQGFVDISIRITAEGEDPRSHPRNGAIMLMDHEDGITLSSAEASTKQQPQIVRRRREILADPTTAASLKKQLPIIRRKKGRENQSQNPTEERHPNPPLGEAYHPSPPAPGLSYRTEATMSYGAPRAPSPPPPPPLSNAGFVPTFLPRTDGNSLNVPPYQMEGKRDSNRGFAMGLGAGALAAGAVIFGDDFLSGFDIPQA